MITRKWQYLPDLHIKQSMKILDGHQSASQKKVRTTIFRQFVTGCVRRVFFCGGRVTTKRNKTSDYSQVKFCIQLLFYNTANHDVWRKQDSIIVVLRQTHDLLNKSIVFIKNCDVDRLKYVSPMFSNYYFLFFLIKNTDFIVSQRNARHHASVICVYLISVLQFLFF